MFEKFGEFDSAEEITGKAAELLSGGDTEAIYALAKENGIDVEEADDFIDGLTKELCGPLMAAVEADGEAVQNAIQKALAPSGEGIYSVRIMGVGRLLLSVKELERDITLTNVRTGEKESYTWEQMEAAIGNIMVLGGTVKDSYMAVYDEQFPVKEEEKKEIAPVQPKVEKSKNRSRVTKAAKPVSKKKEASFKTVEPEPERIVPEDVEIVEETVEFVTENVMDAAEILNAELNGRLTETDDLGNWGVKGLPWKELQVGQIITQQIREKLYGCLCKLKDYEKTGLSPEEVEKMMEESK